MSDNFTTNAGSGGDTFGADDISGVKYSRIKLISGVDGTNDGDVAASNPLPVTATGITTLASAIKAEDAASAGGDPGMVVVGMRQDTPAATSGTDGDYEPLRIKAGKLVVDASLVAIPLAAGAAVIGHVITDTGSTTAVTGNVTVVNAGTFAVQAAITAASGSIQSGAIASGAVASGAIASGALASGSIAAGAIAAGATSIADNEDAASADGDRGVKMLAVRKASPANTSGTDGDYEFLQVSAGRLWTASSVTFGGTRSYKTASGTLTADTDVVAAVTSKRIKVFAFSVTTVGTNANAAIWKSNGTSGTELWRTLLQGASGSPMGERLAVSPGTDGAFLFATVAGEKLTLDVGNGDTLHYSISYWDDDAT